MRAQEHIGQLRVEQVDEKQHQHGPHGHLQHTDTPPLLLVRTPRIPGFALGADVLSGLVFAVGILGALAAQLGTALFTGLLLGVVITRDVIEFVRVPFERGKA